MAKTNSYVLYISCFVLRLGLPLLCNSVCQEALRGGVQCELETRMELSYKNSTLKQMSYQNRHQLLS